MTLLVQTLCRGHVGRGVMALEVRPLERRVTGGDAEPGEGVEDALRPLRVVAHLVGVLDAQHERAGLLLGQRPVVQRRAGTTDVEAPRRRRGEAVARRRGSGLGHGPPTLPTGSSATCESELAHKWRQLAIPVERDVRARLRS